MKHSPVHPKLSALIISALIIGSLTIAPNADAATTVTKKPVKAKTTKATKATATKAPNPVPTTMPPTTAPAPTPLTVSAAGISASRCEANKKAGKITYLSGFDWAASASIVEVMVADEKGYFAKMCLDVDLKSSFSTANFGLLADNKAQFASAGSFAEILRNTPKERPLVAVYDLGKTAIDTLMVRDDGTINTLTDLRGKTIGAKGDVPMSVVAMLNRAGLKKNIDYKVQLLDGFNPVAHFALPIDALPGFKSNEPGQLERNVPPVKIKQFDPTEYNIPGSFGLVYSNAAFLKAHPTAAQDFVRAALKGYADAVANPDEAIAIAVKRINAGGNRNFLSPVGEGYRWKVELKIVAASTPAGQPVGLLVPRLLQEQIDDYSAAGVFVTKPTIEGAFDEAMVKGVYGGDGKVIWPAS